MTLQDYSQVDLSPHKLSQEEINDPHLVFDRLFDFAHLPDLREMLWRWLKITVTNGYTKNLYQFRDRDAILVLYEYLEKLLEAAWLLHQQAGEEEEDENEDEEDKDDSDEEDIDEDREGEESAGRELAGEDGLWENWNIWVPFESFYEEWDSHQAEEHLWFMAKQIIANEKKEFAREERNDITLFYEKLKGLVRASSELWAMHVAYREKKYGK